MKGLRIILIGIGVLLLSITISPQVDAQDGTTYGVGTSSLNVRGAPSQDAKTIGSLNPGDQVVVFQENHGWAQTYLAGKEAWVASQYLFPVEAKQQAETASRPSKDTVTVSSVGVRVRSGPGTNYSIIGFTTTGDTYTHLENQNDWVKVMLHDGSTGWIAAWLTDSGTNVSQTAPTTTDKRPHMQLSQEGDGSLAGYNIVLDPGHGGNDPGAIGFNGVMEKNLTLSIAETVASHLRSAGATVKVTRAGDQYVSLDERVQFSGSYQTDAFISLHYNAFPFMAVNGIGTYYSTNGQDRTLAESIQHSIGKHVGLHDRGVHYGNYHVLRENSDLSVLIELGFITNPNDLFTIQTRKYQNNVAEAITSGLENYFD